MSKYKEDGGPPKIFTLTYEQHKKYFGGLKTLIEEQLTQKKKSKKKKNE